MEVSNWLSLYWAGGSLFFLLLSTKVVSVLSEMQVHLFLLGSGVCVEWPVYESSFFQPPISILNEVSVYKISDYKYYEFYCWNNKIVNSEGKRQNLSCWAREVEYWNTVYLKIAWAGLTHCCMAIERFGSFEQKGENPLLALTELGNNDGLSGQSSAALTHSA